MARETGQHWLGRESQRAGGWAVRGGQLKGMGGHGVGPGGVPPLLFPRAWAEREENFLAGAPARSLCQPSSPAYRCPSLPHPSPGTPSVRHGQSLRPPLQVAADRGLRGGQDLSDHSLCRGQLQQHLYLHHR